MRTSVKPIDPLPLTVRFVPPSNANGTSTPGVFRPSDRTYSTWYCVMVMELLSVGARPAASFMASWNVAWPESSMMVPVLLMTSECTVPLPLPPVRLVKIRYDEACPVRMALLHDVSAKSTAAASASADTSLIRPPQTAFRRALSLIIRHSPFGIRHSPFGIRHSAFGIRLPSQDPRRNEDEQFPARVGQRV